MNTPIKETIKEAIKEAARGQLRELALVSAGKELEPHLGEGGFSLRVPISLSV